MKIIKSVVLAVLSLSVMLMMSCSDFSKKNQFKVSDEQPAIGVTFSWYVPDTTLQQLIGPNYTPKVVNDKGEGVLMFFIAKADDHFIGGKASGKLAMAHLLIPVLKMSGLKKDGELEIEKILVSPLTIMAEGKEYFEKLHEKGFALVRGEIEISIEETDEELSVRAIVSTAVGKDELGARFENLPVDRELVTVVINPAAGKLRYFYGKEKVLNYENGKGSVKSEGNTFYSGLNLIDYRYTITLHKNLSWDFYFEEE